MSETKEPLFRAPLFLGEFDLTLDASNRFTLPDELRSQFRPDGNRSACVVVIGFGEKLCLYSESYYRAVMSADAGQGEPIRAKLAHPVMEARAHFNGRWQLTLPQPICKHLNLSREIALIGCWDHLEIWQRTEWRHYRKGLTSILR